MDVKMNDAELIDLLLDVVKQDDKRNYFGFVKVRSNSKMSPENIVVTSASFDENYKRIKCIIDGANLDKKYLRYLKGKLMEGGFFTELSTSFDLYNGALAGFFASILAIIIFIDNSGPKGIWWVKAFLTTVVLGAASFSLFRRSQTNAQKVHLQRLKSYLDVYLDNYDFYQAEAAKKV
jgi:hypothetical protein